MIYGYARVSTTKQNIERQIRNIKAFDDSAIIVQDTYTGTKMDRPNYNNLKRKIKAGDTIIFDSVSRMSRDSKEGVKEYFKYFDKGVKLVFLKERYIDTDVFADNMKDKIELNGTDEDEIFKGINNYFRKLAEKQIIIAFEQAEKEVQDLHQRTKEGIETARIKGKQIGQKQGAKLNVKKSTPCKERILELSKDFDGNLSDADCMKIIGIARNTYYKYKKELKES